MSCIVVAIMILNVSATIFWFFHLNFVFIVITICKTRRQALTHTGAKTSSIHAKNIKSFKKDGDHWLSFTLSLTDSDNNKHEIQMEKPEYRSTNIKNHDGNYDTRHVIKLDMCFNGHVESTEFTLADRSEYIYDILLGRRFLKMFAIVDSKRIFLTTAKCAKNS